MPILNESIEHSFRRLAIDQIIVKRDERQRKEIEVEDLKQSIKRNGLINPIVVSNGFQDSFLLVAGERRLEACRQLGWTHIPVHFTSDLTTTELSIIELEENIKRSDLEWDDLCRAVFKVHNLHLQVDPEWTHADTAEVCSLARSTVSQYIRVAIELDAAPEDNPAVNRIKSAGTIREAYNVINRRDQRVQADALESILNGPQEEQAGQVVDFKPSLPSIEETILHQSFLDWAPSYSGPKFNFIHCDFPYGIGVFGGPQGRGDSLKLYDDENQIYLNLIKCLGKNLSRLSSISCHIMFWFSEKQRHTTFELFDQYLPSVVWQPYPLIWVKSDNAGIAADPRRGPRHIYETCLMGTIGPREVVQLVGDAYSSPSDHRLHPSTKPEAMLRHFFRMFVDENTRMLDPTCGSGAAIRAAESLDAAATLGVEVDKTFCQSARNALKSFRLLRGVK